MRYSPTFLDLVGDEEEFFATYFNHKPLLRRGALAADACSLLSASDLDELLDSEVIRPPHVAVTKGDQVHSKTYTAPMRVQRDFIPDRVLPDKIIEHFKSGATITWPSLNHVLPHMRELTAMLSEKFAGRSDVVAFATPAGRKGFVPHQDSVDLFIIQTQGTKDWQVWNPPRDRSGEAEWFTMEQLGPPSLNVTLEPGDVLYLPYNSPHVAAATDSLSIHLSVMVRPRRWTELLQDLVRQATADDHAFFDYPYLNADNASFADELHDAVRQLTTKLESLSSADVLRTLRSEPEVAVGSSMHTFFVDQSAADTIGPRDLIALNDTAVELSYPDTEPSPDKQAVRINGATYAFPRLATDSLRELTPGRAVNAGAFVPTATPAENLALVQTMLRLGVVRRSEVAA